MGVEIWGFSLNLPLAERSVIFFKLYFYPIYSVVFFCKLGRMEHKDNTVVCIYIKYTPKVCI